MKGAASGRVTVASLGRRWLLVAVGLVILVCAAIRLGRVGRRLDGVASRSVPLPTLDRREDRYVGAASCRPCHPSAYATWHGSFHRTMTQTTTGTSVAGRFDGTPLDARGHRAWRSGETFVVDMPDARGMIATRDVVMVTGSHHMQIYWVGDANGALVSFPYAFLLPEATWVPNESTLLRPLDAGVVYTWNRVCIKCHAVAGIPGFDPERERVRSGVVDLGIACEACHGPGAAHVQAHRSPWSRYASYGRGGPRGIVQPAKMEGGGASEVCGQCHSITAFHDDERYVEHGHDHPPPDPIDRWGIVVRHPVHEDQPHLDDVLAEDSEYLVSRFWPDGMVRVSGREYNGLVESPCRAAPRFGCLSCHAMHDYAAADDQLRVDLDEDGMCRSCHADPQRWGVAHTHHAPESEGSRCMNCHMPHTTYGLLKAMRSHQIDLPSVRSTIDTGRPNACNACHLDRSLAWTAGWLTRWFDQPAPEEALSDEPAMMRMLLAGDAGARAISAWHFGWSSARAASPGASGPSGWGIPLVAELLVDPYPAVRWVALRTLERLGMLPEGAPGRLESDAQGLRADVLERWRARASPGDADARALEEAMVRWRSERDERPLHLAE